MVELQKLRLPGYVALLGSTKLKDPERDEAAIDAYLDSCMEEFAITFKNEQVDLKFGKSQKTHPEEEWKLVRPCTFDNDDC